MYSVAILYYTIPHLHCATELGRLVPLRGRPPKLVFATDVKDVRGCQEDVKGCQGMSGDVKGCQTPLKKPLGNPGFGRTSLLQSFAMHWHVECKCCGELIDYKFVLHGNTKKNLRAAVLKHYLQVRKTLPLTSES